MPLQHPAPTRRSFLLSLTAITGGLVLGISLPGLSGAATSPLTRIRLGTDNTVTVITGKSEMGQGVDSAFAQIVADVLGADWQQMRTESGPVSPLFRPEGIGEQITGGSMSIRLHHTVLRQAAASTRDLLIRAAAARWQVRPEDCLTESGSVLHRPSQQRLPFGALAEEAARLSPRTVTPETAADPTGQLTGHSLPRLDIPDKITGRTRYGLDQKRPGGVYAAIHHLPFPGAVTVPESLSEVRQMPGVLDVVPVSGGWAVTAPLWWSADRAARMIRFYPPEDGAHRPDSAGISRLLHGEAARTDAPVALSRGRIPPRPEARDDAVYEMPLLAHFCLEPMSCTAEVTATTCEVWAPTQGQDAARRAAAAASGLPPEAVTLHTVPMGGGFGRRYDWDFVTQSVEIARATGRPVTLLWSREEDIRADFFRPPSVTRIAGSCAPDGRIEWLDIVHAAPSANEHAWPGAVKDGIDMGALDGFTEPPYLIPALRIRYALTPVPVRVGFWRSVAFSGNVPVLEAFVDELAGRTGLDPLAFRLANLAHDPRSAAVLKACAEAIGWDRPRPNRQAVGIAFAIPMMTRCAVAAEVTANGDNLRVTRLVVAVDCGTVINPDGVRAQAEGGAVWGLGAALRQHITLRNGQVEQQTLADCAPLLATDIPRIDVVIIPSDRPPTGMGEPSTPVTCAAVMNAVSRIRGIPARRLPLLSA